MHVSKINYQTYYYKNTNKVDSGSKNEVNMQGNIFKKTRNSFSLKKLFKKLFSKTKDSIQDTVEISKPKIRKEYKKRRTVQSLESDAAKVEIKRAQDPIETMVKNVFLNGIQIDKVYESYLPSVYTRTKYENSLPISKRGDMFAPKGVIMKFKSGYSKNFRKTQNGSITLDYNKNNNPAGKVKSLNNKINNREIEVEVYRDINLGNFERRITRKINSQIKSDIYCNHGIPELMIIYEKPGNFDGKRCVYKFYNNSERVSIKKLEGNDISGSGIFSYERVLNNSQAFPDEVLEIVRRNLYQKSNDNLVKNLSNLS